MEWIVVQVQEIQSASSWRRNRRSKDREALDRISPDPEWAKNKEIKIRIHLNCPREAAHMSEVDSPSQYRDLFLSTAAKIIRMTFRSYFNETSRCGIEGDQGVWSRNIDQAQVCDVANPSVSDFLSLAPSEINGACFEVSTLYVSSRWRGLRLSVLCPSASQIEWM